jgi:hypothetical protein
MNRLTLLLVLALGLAILQGCASAPKPAMLGIASDRPLTTQRDTTYAQSERYVDSEAVLTVQRVGLPRVRVGESAAGEGITPLQADLVANRAARDVCTRLGRHFALDDAAPELDIELVITALRPTSSGAAGASAILGVFVPGPFRLPAGLGGFAADGVARRSGKDLLVLRWAEGAGAITEDAKVSRIGDAYQLAADFAADFAKGLIDPRGSEGDNRPRVDAKVRAANDALCLARFGKASMAGRGASLILPLSPEAIDDGAPKRKPRPQDDR